MSTKHNFEAWYPELPDLLFGQVMGVSVFNATAFMDNRNIDQSKCNISDYKEIYSTIINLYAKKLGFDSPEQLFLTDDNGDTMIHEVLTFSFVEYIDPAFSIYMHDRMHELFYNGMVVSDNYLAVAAKRRLPKSVLEKLASV